ncbi:MAG: RNA polymerase sigma factor [Paracoccaceae bacterium]|nr:MAG: RNA polymerase sigma factor [Paracoccaceae bacterium]
MTHAPDPRDEWITHVPAMRAFAISLARDTTLADDLVQDALVRAWAGIDGFRPGTNMRAWPFTILRNGFYSLRRKRRRKVGDPDGIHAAGLAEAPGHDGRLAYADFERAFHALSDEHREVLVLIGAEGFSCEEAAQMMGVAVGTVKSRASRARARLAELMGLGRGESALIDSEPGTRAAIAAAAARAG